MLAEKEKVSLSCDGCFAFHLGNLVGWIGSILTKIQHDRVNFPRIEACDADVEADLGETGDIFMGAF
jgi:hypothetical protein